MWDAYRLRVEQALQNRLSAYGQNYPQRLADAMSYVCLNGGKRVRAALVYACGELAGSRLDHLDVPACAVEMIHAYSLTHDDLPAMDDDDLRRGRPTCHIQFDEATAVLAGDALQSLSFQILAEAEELQDWPRQQIEMIRVLSDGIGGAGMAGGQQLDMDATNQTVDFEQLQQIHMKKTAALISASAQLGVLCCENPDQELLAKIKEYALNLGLLFQIVDDILDTEGNEIQLGKPVGSDESQGKSTYVALWGIDKANQEADRIYHQAIESIHGLGDNSVFLNELVHFVRYRNH